MTKKSNVLSTSLLWLWNRSIGPKAASSLWCRRRLSPWAAGLQRRSVRIDGVEVPWTLRRETCPELNAFLSSALTVRPKRHSHGTSSSRYGSLRWMR